ncbi:MAG: PAS domain S-box protein [Inquilinus sp.]|uniref:PAS domain S-box protein n=1 Tax=Inquilinus sp. TaxID=1932117 RepID=UPI003F3D929D
MAASTGGGAQKQVSTFTSRVRQGAEPNGLLGGLPVAVYTTDATGKITYYNEAAAELWGRHPELGRDEYCGAWKLFWPDGTPLPHNECPMALSLKEKRPFSGMEAIVERPDGTQVRCIPHPTPLFDDMGNLTGGVNTVVDITDRYKGELAAQRLAAIVESSDDAVLVKDLNGIITTWNRGAERLFGYTAHEMIGKPVTLLIPADRQDEEPAILARLRRGEHVEHYETIRQRKDGSLIDVSLTVSPVRSSTGEVVGASKIARDITERKRAQERQMMLLREMSHRVKNIFALSGAVITLSTRAAHTPEGLADAVRNRLGALARAHDLTLPDLKEEQAETPTTLSLLVQTILSPYQDGLDHHFTVDGPDVRVAGPAVTSLALLLHELATNAAKYGALSRSSGRISVKWSIEGDHLSLTWTERGGPTIAEPSEVKGFGTWLSDGTVTGQLGGTLARLWDREGLSILLTIPIGRLSPLGVGRQSV